MSEAEAVAFPIESAHMAILATVHLSSAAVDPFAWKRYCWRALQPDVLERVVAHVDIYWAFLALTQVAPDIYIAAAHTVADRVVPRRQPPKSELASLAPHPPRYSPDEIHALQEQVSQRARQRGYRSRADTLRTAAITGATRRALRLPTGPLQPFAGLSPSPDEQPVTPEARLAEVHAQAAYVQEDRWVRVDVQAVRDATSWEPWFTVFRPEKRPPHVPGASARPRVLPHVVAGGYRSVRPRALPTSSPSLASPHHVSPQGPLPGDGAGQPTGAPFRPFVGRPTAGRPSGPRPCPDWRYISGRPHRAVRLVQGLRRPQRPEVLPPSVRQLSHRKGSKEAVPSAA